MKDDNITEAAIEEIAAILAAGYLRYRLEQFSAKSTAVRVDTSVSSSPHGVEVALHLLDLLQWGRDQTIAEIASLLSYSIFKELAPALRAHPLTSRFFRSHSAT